MKHDEDYRVWNTLTHTWLQYTEAHPEGTLECRTATVISLQGRYAVCGEHGIVLTRDGSSKGEPWTSDLHDDALWYACKYLREECQ